jgi:hypothetical protein
LKTRSFTKAGDHTRDIESVDYYSDGNTLGAILWLYFPVKSQPNPINEEVDYGVYIDAELDNGNSDVWEGFSSPTIDRGVYTDDDTQVIVDNSSNKPMFSTCKKCYDRCKNAKKSRYNECKKCGGKCGFKVRLSNKGKVKVTNTKSNMVLAMQGQYYDGRVHDQSYVLRSEDDYYYSY